MYVLFLPDFYIFFTFTFRRAQALSWTSICYFLVTLLSCMCSDYQPLEQFFFLMQLYANLEGKEKIILVFVIVVVLHLYFLLI